MPGEVLDSDDTDIGGAEMKSGLDHYQREAVDTDRSSVVTAGAGSGKTTVLAERFVHLIAEGRAEVDSILTLTFTRKAAAEMYERIYRRLGERLEEERSEEEQRKEGHDEGRRKEDRQALQRPQTESSARVERLSRALSDFSSARISTIDSFCAQVVRGGSGRFGIPGDFVQDEHAVSELIEESALTFLLSRMDRPSLSAYIRDHGFSRVLESLFLPLAKNEFHLAETHDFPGLFARQRSHIEAELRVLVSNLEVSRRGFLDLDGSGAWYTRISALLESLEELDAAADEGWENLAEIMGAVKLDLKGATSKKEENLEAKRIIQEMQETWDHALAALDLLTRSEYGELYELLAEYEQIILSRRRSAGVLTFRDVVEMTVALLTEDTELLRYYKESFDHIMIDEFQDNNDLQRRLLYLLSERCGYERVGEIPAAEDLEEGKLFFVGDEKQSIYRFRGADVSVFTGLQSEIARTGGTALSLQYNYRSHPELIDFFNRFFAGFLADPYDREDFEAAYSRLTAFRKRGGVKPQIRLFYKPYVKERDENALEPSDAEAWHVATRIREMVEEEKLTVWDREEERPCRWDDIAVLMRSTGNQLRYERYFRRLGIPYSVQSTRSLFMEAPVNDIYLMLQLLVYPDDVEAYAGVLRSPFVHLSDETAFSILLDRRNEPDRYGRPFSHSGDEELFGSEEERRKYRTGRETFTRLEEMKGRAPASELIRYLWYEGGYRYLLLRRPDYHIYLEFYETLTELARTVERRGESLPAFLDYLRRKLGENEKIEEIELPPSGESGVQIMTIHKAKGLEFPIVVLVDMGNTGSNSGSGPLFVNDTELGPSVRWKRSGATRGGGSRDGKGYFESRYEKAETERRRAELKRLLYVACTRAQDHLFLSGIHHSANRNMEKQGAEALLNTALSALGWDENPEEVDLASLQIEAEEIAETDRREVDRQTGGVHARQLPSMDGRYADAELIRPPLPQKLFTPVELNTLLRHAMRAEAEGASRSPEAARSDASRAAGRGQTEPPERRERLARLEIDDFLQSETEITAFGTLCHRLIEEKLEGQEPSPMSGWPAVRPAEQLRRIEQTARLLSDRFLATPLGEEARGGDFESELSFLLRIDGAGGSETGATDGTKAGAGDGMSFIKGQMDLCLIRTDSVLVLDFKTDRVVAPEHYAGQMAAYRRAAEELYGLPASSSLVYLREMRIVAVDTEIDIASLCRR